METLWAAPLAATGLSGEWDCIRGGRPLATPASVGVGRSPLPPGNGGGVCLPPSCSPSSNR